MKASTMLVALCALAVSAGGARADTIFEVESARAKERAGRYLSDQDIDLLERWGSNDDRRYYYYYDYADPYDVYGPPPRRLKHKKRYRKYRYDD